METKWVARFGTVNIDEQVIRFAGGAETTDEGREYARFAEVSSNRVFSGGTVSAKFAFADVSNVGCGMLIIRQNLDTGAILVAGIGGVGRAYSVRIFDGKQWSSLKEAGDWSSIEANRSYDVSVHVTGTRLELRIDGVAVLQTGIPAYPTTSQVGVWCQSRSPITITEFKVDTVKPTAFVIMQFGHPYDTLFRDVIEPVCKEAGIVAMRADQECGPGLVIADVVKRIATATLIVAEITPPNENVFYEVGFAHAIGKPTILVAERGKKLPFDVSGFRTLFYDNSIGGKSKIEADLKQHIAAIMTGYS
ncbi:MAG: hypothetical protein SF069_13205 [Phycisphaerae bacterium]|nr:hypothetical protein [Phycisphaerae bacterium]